MDSFKSLSPMLLVTPLDFSVSSELMLNKLGDVKNNNVTEVLGGARGVMVIVVGNEHGDMSSNPGRD